MRPIAAVVAAVLVAGVAAAHWQTPEAVVAQLNGPEARMRWGVERAVRDENAPRLLVVRVGAGWYTLAVAQRVAEAEGWLALWRHNVPEGIVAVLDAASDRPVVQFAPGGRVVSVAATPPR